MTPDVHPFSLTALKGKKVLIVGGGVTGIAVKEALLHLGALPTIVDEKTTVNGASHVISTEEADQQVWDLAVVSPGWRPDHAFLVSLRLRNVPLISEVDLAWQIKMAIAPSQKWIGVTGTNGKTTTVEMVAAILLAAGLNAHACGNVGETVIQAVLDPKNFDYLVVELSSFQLQWSDRPSYVASAILNIADDHVDWHGSFEAYAQAKLKILQESDLAVLNGDDGAVLTATQTWDGKKVFFTLSSPRPGEMGVVEDLLVDRAFVTDTDSAEVICELAEISPFAPHSVLNSLAAASLALAIGIERDVIRRTLANFRPGRHRIESVLVENEIQWINDSKATNPHAALASLKSFNSIIWLAGGLAKGANMAELISRGGGHLKSAILFGRDRELIAQELERSAPQIPIMRIDQDSTSAHTLMQRIVLQAKEMAQPGDVVLLAPACASMDQFISYADRGDQFCEAVRSLVAQT